LPERVRNTKLSPWTAGHETLAVSGTAKPGKEENGGLGRQAERPVLLILPGRVSFSPVDKQLTAADLDEPPVAV
jgi:hypothetical protein